MFYDIFIRLCREKNISPAAVVREIGLNNSSPTAWKRGSIPKSETLQKLADYFGVSTDYLLEIKPLPDKEIAINLGFKKEKAIMSSGAIEFEAFDQFITDIGFRTYVDPSRFNGPKGKNSDVWIIEDIREKKYYAATTDDLDRLKDQILSYSKFQIYQLIHKLKQIDEKQALKYQYSGTPPTPTESVDTPLPQSPAEGPQEGADGKK